MVAQVGEQVLLGAELVGQLVWTESCPIVSLDGIGALVYSHLGVLDHSSNFFWNLIMIVLNWL